MEGKEMAKKKTQNRKKVQNRTLLYGIVAVVFIVAVATVGFALAQSNGAVQLGYPQEVTLEDGVALRDSGAFVLDVRTPEEWEEYHVPGSTLIPLDELEYRLDEIPADREVLVVCRSGNRSAVGRDILLGAGFEQVTSLGGGLSRWKAAGYPIETGL